MIAGIGIDLVEIARIKRIYERFGSRFCARLLDPREEAQMRGDLPTFLAGRFAAKEAAVKAMGTGFNFSIAPPDIAVFNDSNGKPYLTFQGAARLRLENMGVSSSHLSISHEKGHAVALVVLETI